MFLSENTIAILKSCHPVLLENRIAIGKKFYELLFYNHPELKKMFNMTHTSVGKDGEPGAQV